MGQTALSMFPADVEPGYREFLDFPVKRPRGNAQRFCGFGLVTLGVPERLFNETPFAFLNIPYRLGGDFVSVSGGVLLQVHRQIADGDVVPV